MRTIRFIMIFSLMVVILTSCGNSVQEAGTATSISESPSEVSSDKPEDNSANQTESYPPSTLISDGYPAQDIDFAYPAPPVYDENKRFTIEEPLKPGDNTISGRGPANVPIKVVSISDVGQSMGAGVTDEKGNFNINISPPLQANYVIGLMLSDDNMRSEFLDGPGYSDLPMIGLVLTMSVVESE